MITLITSVFNPPTQHNLSALYAWNLIGVPVVVVSKGLTPEVISFPNVQIISDAKTEQELGAEGDSPYLKDMLRRGLELVSTPMVGLINADILMRKDFTDRLREIIERRGQRVFLTSVRRDTKFHEQVMSEETFVKVWNLPKRGHQDKSADLFISSKEEFSKMIGAMPEFIYGRTIWDNWIHSYFKDKSGVECFNSSSLLEIVHLEHTYDHLKMHMGDHPSVRHNMSLVSNHSFISVGTWPQP